MIKMSITGVGAVMTLLQSKKGNVDSEVKTALGKIGLHMQNEVKESISGHRSEPTSVDTGHLMRNVFFQTGKKEVAIFTHVSYANIVENSTRIKGGPRRHFQNSLNRNKAKIKEIVEGQINNI